MAERPNRDHDLSAHALRHGLALPFAAGRTVLDAGSGTGYGAQPLAIVVALGDLGRSKCSGQPSAVATVTALPFPEASFGVVTSFEVIEHLTEQDLYVRSFVGCFARRAYYSFQRPTVRWKSYTTGPLACTMNIIWRCSVEET
jgi:2-polyprenyl-3-methyl-5-hydroxy-6-metoxy-1,4-benzoquinol methylase